MKFGNFEVTVHNHGMFRLDGGAMFGSVPKNLWSKKQQPDEENCIRLATRCLILKSNERCFLIDTGFGTKWNDKARQIFDMQPVAASDLKYDYQEVTDVILTHLHFDHSGGVSYYDDEGELKLRYPEATHHVQAANFANASAPNTKEKASYLPENVQILKDAKLNLIDGDSSIYSDIFVHRVDGHTVGQQYVEVRNGEKKLYYPADLIPTSSHVPLAYHMGYDICASTVLKEKSEFLEKACKENALIVFEHDPVVEAAYIAKDEKGNYSLGQTVSF